MPRRHLRLAVADAGVLHGHLAKLRTDLGVPESFAPDVVAEAEAAARSIVQPELDLREIPFVSIDPPGSQDVDQAMHLERTEFGFRVRYAIADVASFVNPGGALDLESHRRGVTLYSPGDRAPMLPPVLSEGAASLLAGQDRPACVWTIELDRHGEGHAVDVRRAMVRNREQLTFDVAQQRIDAGDEMLALLAEVGRLREVREAERGGINVTLPEQEIVAVDGGYALRYRAGLPVEGWNAQISLLTGCGAGELMMYGEIGILRTMPEAALKEVERLHRVARALGIAWPTNVTYASLLRSLDPHRAADLAFQTEAMSLVRGAGYVAFDGGVPEQPTHAAVAGEYAHCTAPLRRLVDRYATEVCIALCADQPVPPWARGALSALPGEMASADRRANELERESIALMEALVLADEVGEVFQAVVVDSNEHTSMVQLREPAVRSRCEGVLTLGAEVSVRLTVADPETRTVRFVPEP